MSPAAQCVVRLVGKQSDPKTAGGTLMRLVFVLALLLILAAGCDAEAATPTPRATRVVMHTPTPTATFIPRPTSTPAPTATATAIAPPTVRPTAPPIGAVTVTPFPTQPPRNTAQTSRVPVSVQRGCDAASELLALMENLDEAGIERNLTRLARAIISTGEYGLDAQGRLVLSDMASAEQYVNVYDAFWVIESGLETYIHLCELQGYTP